MGERDDIRAGGHRRYARDTLEFSRVANLSDGLFAIALTVLMLTLDPAEVSVDRLGGALLDQPGELIAFALSFAVIATSGGSTT
jgi:uncharacterized membrane protein